MNKLSNVLVTTTNILEGLKIKQYLKPLSAHVVAGTNFFSDFFASFSDIFGGRSGTYQRQLSSIYTEAIEILKQSAAEIGANAVIGLRVDLDEISGKGKSMFMITAIGTAVVIENLETIQKAQTVEKLSIISVEKMDEFRKRREIIQLAKENKLIKNDMYGNLSYIDDMDNVWEFITSNSVYEVANEILDLPFFSTTYPKLLSYFSSLDTNFTTNLLFDKLMNDKSSSKKYLFDLMRDLRIFDSEKIISYLQSDNEMHRSIALQLVVYDKQTYLKEDVAVFEKIIQIINSSFKEIVSYSTTKGLLTKEKEVWICECGTKNDKELEYCTLHECGKDKYGFLKSQTNPLKAIKKLEDNIEIIKENLF